MIYQDRLIAFYVGGKRLRVTERHLHDFLRRSGVRLDDRLLTIPEVATRLKVSPQKVRNLMVRKLNRLIAVQLGTRRLWVTERHPNLFQEWEAEELRPDDTLFRVAQVAARLNLSAEDV